jgi:hypothetical protein
MKNIASPVVCALHCCRAGWIATANKAIWRAVFLSLVLLHNDPSMAAAADFPPRPFVLVNSNELATLRTELSQSGWKQDAYHKGNAPDFVGGGHAIRPNADLWLNRAITIPARGGHYHWFFCTDGTRLTMPTNQLFVAGPYQCSFCGKTYSGEQYESAVRRLAHGWLSVAARDLALVSAIEQKPEYAAKAGEILLKYADAYPGPHTSNTEGGMIYQSLDESMWVIPLAQAFDLIHDQLTATQQQKISTFLKTAAGGIQRCGTGGNWGSWHLSAVGVAGYATGDSNLVNWATQAFKAQIQDQLGDDGLWPESVQTYHFFPLQAFQYFAEAAWHAGVDLYRWEGKPGKSLAAMFIAPLDYAYPNLQLAAINDGWFQSYLPPDAYELAWHRLPAPRFEWVLSRSYAAGVQSAGTAPDAPAVVRRNGLYAFLFGRALPASVPAPAARSVNFPVLGICVLRSTNGAMLTFDYGPMLGHGQLDKMGITFFTGDRLWAADHGTPGYGAEILPWYKSTFAHNTIVVDGHDQSPTKENAADLWLGDSWLEAARSTTTNACPGVIHTRTVVRLGECFIIRDQLKSQRKHDYDFYFRSEGTLSMVGNSLPGKSRKPAARWIEGLRTYEPRAEVSGVWQTNAESIRLTMVGEKLLTPITAQCPAETGCRRVDLLIVRQSGRTAEFITALSPSSKVLSLKTGRLDEVQISGPVAGLLTFPHTDRGPIFVPTP